MQMCSGLTKNKERSPEFVGSSGCGAAEASKSLGPQAGPFLSTKDTPVTSPGNGKHSHKGFYGQTQVHQLVY